MKSTIILALTLLLGYSAQAQTTTTDPKKGQALITLGATSAAALYNSYLAIGAIADAYGVDAYPAKNVGDLMTEQVNLLELLKTQVNNLITSGFLDSSATDVQYCQDIMACIDVLVLEAGGLKEYALSGDLDAQLNYAHARDDAWGMIVKLLQIE